MPELTVLYVTEPGAYVGLKRERVEVRKGDAILANPRVDELETVALCGMIHLSPNALFALMTANVDVIYLRRSGTFVGRISGDASRRVSLRHKQLRLLDDETFGVDIARRIVAGKIRNQRTLLMRRPGEGRSDAMARAMVQMRLCVERLEDAKSVEVIRGHEGAAAAAYFGVFDEMIRAEGITFPGRVRRPPPDPTNILLSFGYTLLGKLMHGALEVASLDPYCGTLHAPEDNRPSLALDLIEEFRPTIVDTLVISVLNRRTIRATDFTPATDEDAPVEEAWERAEAESNPNAPEPRRKLIFNREAVKRFLVAYERRLLDRVFYAPQGRQLTYRQVIQEQVYRYSRHIRGEGTYEPYVMDL